MSLSLARKRAAFYPEEDKNAPLHLSSLYRSASYPSAGATRRVGNMHMHLDCSKSATSEHRLVELAKMLEVNHWPSKVSRVNLSKPGLHIANPEYKEDYLHHTPELCAGVNTFAAYLTTLLDAEVIEPEKGFNLCKKAREIMSSQTTGFSQADVVVEIERVSALISPEEIKVASPSIFPSLNQNDNPLFEIHHLVEVPRSLAVNFDEWQGLCNLSGIVVGGWFQFDKEQEQALRSVRFARKLNMFDLVDETKEIAYILREHVGVSSNELKVQTVVEQVVDIWRF